MRPNNARVGSMFCVQTGPFSCHWVLLTSWMQIWWQQINKYLRHTEPVASNSPRVRISWGWSLVTHTMFVMRTECDTTTPFASQVSIICIMPDNVMRDPTWGNEKTKAKWRVNITRRDKYFLVLRSLFRLRFQSEILSANTVWGSLLSPALASLHSPSFMYRTPGSYSLCFLCSWVLIQFAWNSYDKIHHLTGWQGFPPLNLTSPSITAMIGNLMRKVGLLAICLLPDPRVFTVIFSRYSHHRGSLPALLFWARTPEHWHMTHKSSLITCQFIKVLSNVCHI